MHRWVLHRAHQRIDYLIERDETVALGRVPGYGGQPRERIEGNENEGPPVAGAEDGPGAQDRCSQTAVADRPLGLCARCDVACITGTGCATPTWTNWVTD